MFQEPPAVPSRIRSPRALVKFPAMPLMRVAPKSAEPRRRSRPARRGRIAHLLAAAVAPIALLSGGCEVASFLNPANLVDPDKENQLAADGTATPIVQVILDDLDLGVTPPEGDFAGARDVQASDLEVVSVDYVVGPADFLRIEIYDYPEIGAQQVIPVLVSDTGFVTLPEVDQIEVQGLTEGEVADAVIDEYVAQRLLQPGVGRATVTAIDKKNRTFTIGGTGVGRPAASVPITRADFRILNALAQASGVFASDSVAEYLYVIRRTDLSAAGGAERRNPSGQNGGAVQPGPQDPLSPQGNATPNRNDVNASEWDAPTFASAIQNGQSNDGGFEFQPPEEPTNSEVIRVPLRELLAGALKYNIVVRPGDTILVPGPDVGVYYIGGNANGVGVYTLSPGNAVTLKRAIISARGLNAVAIPQRTQLIRRYGDQDAYVRVDLKKVFLGVEPDQLLKPDDMIMVGTNLPAPFLASFRNAFRVTYGFGFLYDRNFARSRENSF